MKFWILVSTLFIFTLSCTNRETHAENRNNTFPSEASQSIDTDTLTYRVVYVDSVGWGYQIFQGPKLIIDQKHIPAVQGMNGFKSKQSAETTARYILIKINQGVFPPTISKRELDSLQVL